MLLTWLGCSNGQTHPNIVWIIIDTLRADKLGAYGFKANTSPELDRLAADGVIFKRVMTQASWTRPSIGSMLTSQYPRTLGLYQEQWDVLPDDAVTAAEIFKQAGYATLGITANPNINTSFGFGQGFDRYINSEVLFHWMDGDAHSNQNGQVNGDDDAESEAKVAKSASNFEKIRMPAKDVFKIALKELQTIRNGPFYLQINIMDVHGGHKITKSEVDADLKELRDPGYLQSVRIASSEVGKFTDAIKALVQGPTLFVITSDHGEGLKDHPGVPNSSGHGKYLYESVLSVPIILYGHKLDTLPKKSISQQVRMLDLLPTVVEIAGLTGRQFEGISLKPLIDGSVGSIALPPSYSETHMRGANKVAVHSPDWGFIENRDGWKWLDPAELQVAGGSERARLSNKIKDHPEIASSLSGDLNSWDDGYSSRPPASADPSQISQSEIQRLRSLGYIK
jgi:arylsulfatase A-like enzyme